MKLLEAIYAIRIPLLWVGVICIGMAAAAVASGVPIPGLERKIAVSDETRDALATERAPTFSREYAIDRVKGFLRTECKSGEAYFEDAPQFTASFMSSPVTDDHHERGAMEWTVIHSSTGDRWRFYETTGEIITVLGDC